MDDRHYRHFFGETNRQRRERHNACMPTGKPASPVLKPRQCRGGDGWEVVDGSGKPVASGFDNEAECLHWIAGEHG